MTVKLNWIERLLYRISVGITNVIRRRYDPTSQFNTTIYEPKTRIMEFKNIDD